MSARAVIVPGNHGRIHRTDDREDGKTKVIGGKTVTNLPTRGTATKAGEYDEATGGFIPRPRPMTDDQKVGKRPANKKTAGIGVGSVGQSNL